MTEQTLILVTDEQIAWAATALRAAPAAYNVSALQADTPLSKKRAAKLKARLFLHKQAQAHARFDNVTEGIRIAVESIAAGLTFEG